MFGRRDRKKPRNLLETGRRAVGHVTHVRETGEVDPDGRVRVVVGLRVEPLWGEGEPFDAERPDAVPPDAVPRPGERYPVVYDPDVPGELAYIRSDGSDRARLLVVRLFGDAFGPDGDRVGRPPDDDAPPGAEDPLDRLRRLDALRRDGIISEDEFAEQKRRILDTLG